MDAAASACCPVCGSTMQPCERSYDVDELFALWRPVQFSSATIDAHRALGSVTQAHRCTACALEAFVPPIVGTPEFYVEAYNLDQSQGTSTFTYSDDKWEFGEALRDAAGAKRVFEIGCGNGNFLMQAGAAGMRAEGYEYNPAALARARSRGLRVLGPGEEAAAGEGEWDAVFSFHVLEHTDDPLGFVKRMVALSKPGGLIGISVPNQDGPIRYIEPCVMNMPPHHVLRWRLRSFQALAARLGLSIRRVAYEPLLVENHSYYSVHWVHRVISGRSALAAGLRKTLSGLLRLFFGVLRRAGVRYFPLLKGQSIYVVMAAPAR